MNIHIKRYKKYDLSFDFAHSNANRLNVSKYKLLANCKYSYNVLPGHVLSTQASVLRSGPTQSSPPCAGGGLSHVRVRDRDPLPQVTSHTLQPVHTDQPPSTGKACKQIVLLSFTSCTCIKLLCVYMNANSCAQSVLFGNNIRVVFNVVFLK